MAQWSLIQTYRSERQKRKAIQDRGKVRTVLGCYHWKPATYELPDWKISVGCILRFLFWSEISTIWKGETYFHKMTPNSRLNNDGATTVAEILIMNLRNRRLTATKTYQYRLLWSYIQTLRCNKGYTLGSKMSNVDLKIRLLTAVCQTQCSHTGSSPERQRTGIELFTGGLSLILMPSTCTDLTDWNIQRSNTATLYHTVRTWTSLATLEAITWRIQFCFNLREFSSGTLLTLWGEVFTFGP